MSDLVYVMLLLFAVTVTGTSFKCEDTHTYKKEKGVCDSDEKKMFFMKTCDVCTDKGCNPGFVMVNRTTVTCVHCKDANKAEQNNENCKEYCSTCDLNCPSNCNAAKCDRWTGSCESCKPGYYDDKCDRKCEYCDTCNKTTGDCEGKCPKGYYGKHCLERCSEQCKNKSCESSIGRCYECKSSFYGNQCDSQCPRHCLNKSCFQHNGTCTYGCQDGYYGSTCNVNCGSHCRNNTCNSTDGSCECNPGFYGRRCNASCSTNCHRALCHVDHSNNVVCSKGCTEGKMGIYCDQDCPGHCSASCIRTSGRCLNGCKPGYHGNRCSKSCSVNCLSAACVQENGTCLGGCRPPSHGHDCSRPCNDRCRGNQCRVPPGMKCEDGCTDGLWGEYCNVSCPLNCSRCDQDSGRCLECEEGFFKQSGACVVLQNTANSSTNRPLSMVAVVAVALIITSLLVVVAVFILKRKKKMFKHADLVMYTQTNATYNMDVQSVPVENRSDSSSGTPDILRYHRRPLLGNDDVRDTSLFHSERPTSSRCFHNNQINKDNVWLEDIDVHQHYRHSLNIPSVPAEERQREDNLRLHYPDGDGDGDDDIDDIKYEKIFLNSPGRKRISHDICVKDWVADDSVPSDDSVCEEEMDDRSSTPKPCYPHAKLRKADVESLPLLESHKSDKDNSVALEHFATYVHNMVDMQGFRAEFQFLPWMNLFSTKAAENTPKNRYNNIKPYDYNRVKLDNIPGISNSDYINASFIDGYHQPKCYIATQGPMERTVCDFWRMVWTVNAKHIIMLTSHLDIKQVKCCFYWPDPEVWRKKYGHIVVTLKKVLVRPTYTSRTFCLSKNDEDVPTRTVTQLHYTEWVDRGVPDDGSSLLSFIQYAKKHRDTEERRPLIVHCSAGVGRTGTFIAIDYLLEQGLAEGKLDVFGCVFRLRKQRARMVQTEEQYHFIHLLLLKWLSSQDCVRIKEETLTD